MAGQFYKSCGILFPKELQEQSHSYYQAENPKVKKKRVRVSDDTGAWHAGRFNLENPTICYLAEFNPHTSMGLIFLGMSSRPKARRIFCLPVHGGPAAYGTPCFRAVPDCVFQSQLFLNLTLPLRVKIKLVSTASELGVLEGLQGKPRGFLPHVGITGGDGGKRENSTQIVPVRLDAESENAFWCIQNGLRPRNLVKRDGGGGVGKQMGVVDVRRSADADAPWGRIGCFRIGFDVPAILEVNDLSSDDSDAYESDEDVLEIEELGLNCTDATAVLMHIGIGDSF